MNNEIVNFVTWKTYIRICDDLISNSINKTDFDGVEWLSEYIDGYITHPYIHDHNRRVKATTQHIHDITELKQYLANSQSKHYLYRLTYFPKCPSYFDIDDGTLIKKDFPTFIPEEWVVTFVEIPNTRDNQ
jgi:hypothetical protein